MYQNRYLRKMPRDRRTWIAERIRFYRRWPNGRIAYDRENSRNMAWCDYIRLFN